MLDTPEPLTRAERRTLFTAARDEVIVTMGVVLNLLFDGAPAELTEDDDEPVFVHAGGPFVVLMADPERCLAAERDSTIAAELIQHLDQSAFLVTLPAI